MNAPTIAIPLDDSAALAAPKSKNRFALKLAATAAVIGIALAACHYGRLALFTESTDNAYITGHVHRVAANVAGPLLEVLADDNQLVKKGQLLAKIDPREFEIMEKKAISELNRTKAGKLQAAAREAEARATDSQAQAMITSAEAEIKGADARLALARITLKRNETLLAGQAQAISQSVVDQSRGEVEAAGAQLNAAKARLEAARATRESSASSIQAAQADLAAADAQIEVQQSAVDDVRRQKAFTEILAPSDGRIGAKNAETGNRVQTGQALYALIEEDDWIIANFKETQLKKMVPGQEVEITVDSIAGRHFKGRVDSIAPATGAQFALLPPDNATGNFTKVVQRVPVKITFDAGSVKGFEEKIRPGLSTIVRIKVR